MAVVNFRAPNRSPYGKKGKDQNGDRGAFRDAEDEIEEEEYGDAPYEDESFDSGEEEESGSRGGLTRSQRLLLLLRLAVILCVGAAIVLALIRQNRRRSYTASELRTVAEISVPEAAACINLDGKMLIYSKDGASCMDQDGTVLWSVSYEMQRPMVAVAGSLAAIGDYQGSTVHVLSATAGETGIISTNMPMRSLSVAQNGEIAAVLEDSGTAWIYLFDLQGNTIAYLKRTMEQSGYPVATALSPNGALLMCAQVGVDNAEIKTSVAFYNFGAVGQGETDRLVGGYDYSGEVVPFVRFLSNDSAVSVSDAGAVFYTGDEKPVSGQTVAFSSPLKGVWTSSEYVGLLFPDPDGEAAYRLELYSRAGRLVGSIPFTMDFTSIQILGERVIIDDGSNVLVSSVTGNVQFQGSFGDSVLLVLPTAAANRLTLVTRSRIETMILR